jgi:hypothetical protein
MPMPTVTQFVETTSPSLTIGGDSAELSLDQAATENLSPEQVGELFDTAEDIVRQYNGGGCITMDDIGLLAQVAAIAVREAAPRDGDITRANTFVDLSYLYELAADIYRVFAKLTQGYAKLVERSAAA